jgi:hypothetical protein
MFDGILSVTFPKRSPEQLPKKISVDKAPISVGIFYGLTWLYSSLYYNLYRFKFLFQLWLYFTFILIFANDWYFTRRRHRDSNKFLDPRRPKYSDRRRMFSLSKSRGSSQLHKYSKVTNWQRKRYSRRLSLIGLCNTYNHISQPSSVILI